MLSVEKQTESSAECWVRGLHEVKKRVALTCVVLLSIMAFCAEGVASNSRQVEDHVLHPSFRRTDAAPPQAQQFGAVFQNGDT